jgi:hypothetical protein
MSLPAKRSRAAGFLALSVLLLGSLSAPCAMAAPLARATAVDEASAPSGNTGSCVGTNACQNATATIGDNSCNGEEACKSASGTIGDNSCNGYRACYFQYGTIGDNSCNGGDGQACTGAVHVGDSSCNGEGACYLAAGPIGNYSCNAFEACLLSQASVGFGSCNGSGACDDQSTAVGDCVNNPNGAPVQCTAKPDARIRKGSGTYVGNNIYNLTGTNQTRTGSAERGSTITFGIQAQSDSRPDSFRFAATGSATTMYGVTYFRGTTDITAAVVAGTYTTPVLAPGVTFLITAKVKVKSTATVGSSVTRLVTVTSVADGTKKDAVKFIGKRS